jgi:ATP-dependent DNA helicase RecQ
LGDNYRQDKRAVLKDCFGYSAFRPGQEEVIDAILSGRDILAVMPTGAGKSLCYQIPALLLPGLTVVISPLISLMKDQVNALRQAGVVAECLNSALGPGEYARTVQSLDRGECRLLYVAPERLLWRGSGGEGLLDLLSGKTVPLLVVDEAHCVSQWGHDFRPSYIQIPDFLRALPKRPVAAAFTATATLRVKEDIWRSLELQAPLSLTTGFDRKNLYFGVEKPRYKNEALLEFLEPRRNRSGIVYCATRKAVEEVRALLDRRGFAVTRYHAGLDDRERHENQDDFLFDRKTVMVATNAFGMGIDKSNVSFVIHYNMPKNIESYYQEAGRAGRDGEPAECILLYSGQDVRINTFLINTSRDEDEERDEALVEHNLELLKQMTFYATGTDCLRSRLLSYFGEGAPPYCGNCSNCKTLFTSADVTLEARKIVSCVYRLHQRSRRFGKTMIVNILRGSRNEKITALGLDSLSTYGIMADDSAHRIRLILDYLISQGCLNLETGEYPVVVLNEHSMEIAAGKKSVTMMLPQEPERRTAEPRLEPVMARALPATVSSPVIGPRRPEPLAAGIDAALIDRLRELRRNLAKAAAVPAYIVFSDASLRDMCRKRPLTRAAFSEVLGVGAVKTERYAEAFINVIQKYTNETIDTTGG